MEKDAFAQVDGPQGPIFRDFPAFGDIWHRFAVGEVNAYQPLVDVSVNGADSDGGLRKGIQVFRVRVDRVTQEYTLVLPLRHTSKWDYEQRHQGEYQQ